MNSGGNETKSLILGDGIKHLRTTLKGSIWAAYFDEGVFAIYSGELQCIGASGLVCFDLKGNVSHEFDYRKAGGSAIIDAYAMNVTHDEDVWVCFYADFPIVNIASGNYRVWKYGIGGVRGLAVENGRALLYGDYERENRTRLVQLDADGTAAVEAEYLLVDESGEHVQTRNVISVGKNLYFLKKNKILVVDEW